MKSYVAQHWQEMNISVASFGQIKNSGSTDGTIWYSTSNSVTSCRLLSARWWYNTTVWSQGTITSVVCKANSRECCAGPTRRLMLAMLSRTVRAVPNTAHSFAKSKVSTFYDQLPTTLCSNWHLQSLQNTIFGIQCIFALSSCYSKLVWAVPM